MPYIPQDFRSVPGMKAPMSQPSAVDDLPVTPSPPQKKKPNVPLSGKPRRRQRTGLQRIDMRTFEKTPEDILKVLEQTDQ